MDLETYREHCIAKAGVTEEFPFGPETLVFKVGGKMFATLSIDAVPPRTNLKCVPERAVELRAEYPCVAPGYHMNKKHWNTVTLDGSVSDAVVREWVDASYTLVAKGLTKKARAEWGIEV